jgi:hypothetical protein
VKKKVMGFPVYPHATTPSPVFFLSQGPADFCMVTGVSLQVIPCRGVEHPRSSRMAQTPEIMARKPYRCAVGLMIKTDEVSEQV